MRVTTLQLQAKVSWLRLETGKQYALRGYNLYEMNDSDKPRDAGKCGESKKETAAFLDGMITAVREVRV